MAETNEPTPTPEPATDPTPADVTPSPAATENEPTAPTLAPEPLANSAGEPMATPPLIRCVMMQVPLSPTAGYAPSSFGLNLSPVAAQVLADLFAGYAAVGSPVNDHNHALVRLLESLAVE